MKVSEINPFIRFAVMRQQRGVPFFTYSYDCRLMYLRRGELKMHYGSEVYTASEGSLMVWQAGVPYRLETEDAVEIIILNFDFTQNHTELSESLHVIREENYNPEKVLENCRFEDCPELDRLIICKNMRHVENDLMLIVREIRERKRFFGEVASAALKRILCDVARDTLTEGGAEGVVERVIAFIRDNYSRQITNRDIAESVNYHEFYVNKLIRRQTGMTLHRYLLDYRVRNAQKLLVTTQYPISKISELCGFTSSAYFIHAFRRQTTETPAEYRRRRSGLI